MQYYHAGDYDAAVIGAGHAGIEAALALARMGMRTVLFTLNKMCIRDRTGQYVDLSRRRGLPLPD